MTAEDKITLETFRVRFSDFVEQYDKLVRDFDAFREQARRDLIGKDKEIVELSARIEELEKKCEDLRLVRSLVGEGEKSTYAKKRLSGIVREIDKCIALLGN